MGQEFHVLRCFSCQTFQVHQVKRSNKWICKVCFERQSLIKEFGRGTGADCRRHVQKLNSLRGQQHESIYLQNLTQWNEEEQNEDVHQAAHQNHKVQQEQAGVSRWSKYTEQASVEQNELTDEEDNNVYTERPTFRTQGTRNRKRKSFGSDLHLSGKEDLWMGNSGFKRRDNVHPQKPNKMFNSSLIKEQVPKHSVSDEEVAPQTVSFYSTINSSSTFNMQNSDFKQQLPAQSPSVSSHRIWNQSEIETSVSKWSKFLSVPIPEDQEYDCEDENTEGACFTQALKDTKEVSDEKVNNVIKTKENSAGGYQNTFCKQPPLAKLPSCNVSFNSIFCTDEDFDDTF